MITSKKDTVSCEVDLLRAELADALWALRTHDERDAINGDRQREQLLVRLAGAISAYLSVLNGDARVELR